jgi:hydrogenase maturation protein HypF
VQHHVAHVLAATAELGLDEPVIGVVFDGSGFGIDGTSWGAEFLLVDGQRWTRAHSFRALPLAGGERAVREVWRVAFAALRDAFGGAAALELAARLPVFSSVPERSLATLGRMIDSGVSTVRARGVGRWFDAIGALVLGMAHARFEAHVAIALEEAADPGETRAYPIALPSARATTETLLGANELDLRPTVRAVVEDLLKGVPAPRIAARFHRTLIEATATTITQLIAETGIRRVVLSGGAFQNRWLEQGLYERLGAEVVAMARDVPINDGGISLGQAWAAVQSLAASEQEGS